MLKSNLKSAFKNVKKNVCGESYIALTHPILFFLKALFRFNFSIKFPLKLCITWNFSKYFWGGFTVISPSIPNRIDDFEFFLLQYFIKWKCNTSGGFSLYKKT